MSLDTHEAYEEMSAMKVFSSDQVVNAEKVDGVGNQCASVPRLALEAILSFPGWGISLSEGEKDRLSHNCCGRMCPKCGGSCQLESFHTGVHQCWQGHRW